MREIDPTAAVIVAGDDGVALRVREELDGTGVPVVCVCSSRTTVAATAALATGARVVVGDTGSAQTWAEAGVASARAIGVLGTDEVATLNAALLVAELSDDSPIVVRLFQTDLARSVERLLAGRGTVVSETEVAAPAFLHAALSGNTGQRVTVSGRVLEVAEVDPEHPALVVVLANASTPTDVFPTPAEMEAKVLGLVDPSMRMTARGALPQHMHEARAALDAEREATHARRKRRRASVRTRVGVRLPRRALILLGAIAFVLAVSTTVFVEGGGLSVIDAVYFTVTTMATVGYGDFNLADKADWLKVYDIALMGTSAILLASFLALVTEELVSSRIDAALGRYPRPRSGHIVVCGLGKAGARIIAGLHELDIPCVGIEQHAGAPGIAIARSLKIPVILADARTPGTLDELHLDRARALMAMTNDDLANVQAAMTALEHNPDLRIVLRCFDARLAERLDHSIELDLTRSVEALAAPAFVAALLGRQVAEALPLSNVPLGVLEVTVPDGPFTGATVAELERDGDLRVLTCGGRWRPRSDYPIAAGDLLGVVGTRDACDRLLVEEGTTVAAS